MSVEEKDRVETLLTHPVKISANAKSSFSLWIRE